MKALKLEKNKIKIYSKNISYIQKSLPIEKNRYENSIFNIFVNNTFSILFWSYFSTKFIGKGTLSLQTVLMYRNVQKAKMIKKKSLH